jgi:hypothetical protein
MGRLEGRRPAPQDRPDAGTAPSGEGGGEADGYQVK